MWTELKLSVNERIVSDTMNSARNIHFNWTQNQKNKLNDDKNILHIFAQLMNKCTIYYNWLTIINYKFELWTMNYKRNYWVH